MLNNYYISLILRSAIVVFVLFLSCKEKAKPTTRSAAVATTTTTPPIRKTTKPQTKETTSQPLEIAKEQPQRKLAETFLEKIKNRKAVQSLFNSQWTLIYHEDNRSDGSTDGRKDNLKKQEVDGDIVLSVYNDGEGWSTKKEPTTSDFTFNLKQRTKDWTRFEIPNYEGQGIEKYYLHGMGESDYIIIHFNEQDLIHKLEYQSEDPG